MKTLFPPEDTTSLGAISSVLSCFKSIGVDSEELLPGRKQSFKSPSFKELKNKLIVKNGEGFSVVLSLQDGSILYITNSISDILGYPKDMLVGQYLANFLYPRDQIIFASHLTQGLNAQFTEGRKGACESSSFYCRFRQYQSLKFGYGLSEKKPCYRTCHITLYTMELFEDFTCLEDTTQAMCLVATVLPVQSAYKMPGEIPSMTTFSTRHTMSCYFSHVDNTAIPYLGFTPQDMVGNSAFDFYHMDDLPQLKDIYELVMKEQGCPFRSKPYRFLASNGCYITLETEWSSYVNPWTKKLEFVVGQHRVLKGPEDPNVFNEKTQEENPISEELLKASQQIQEEIKQLLAQPVKSVFNSMCKTHSCKRKLAVAYQTRNLLDQIGRKPHNPHVQICSQPNYLRGRLECQDITTPHADQASVVMGEISPHQETHNSDPSAATPPAVQNMQYQENIERFFASQPKTYSSDGSGESKSEERPNTSTDEEIEKFSGFSDEKDKQFSSHSPRSVRFQAGGLFSSNSKRKIFSKRDSGNGSVPSRNEDQIIDNINGSSSCGSAKDSSSSPTWHSLTEEALSQHNRMTQKFFKKISNVSSPVCKGKDVLHHKRSQVKECPAGSHKCKSNHNYTLTTTPCQTEGRAHPMQASGMPYIPFNLAPPFSLPSFPMIVPSAPILTSANSTSGTTSFSNPLFNTTIPNPGFHYCTLIPHNNANGGHSSPFFIPGAMCVGAFPFYPSMSTVIPETGHPLWSCGSMSNVSVSNCGQSAVPNVGSFGYQMFNPSIPVSMNTATPEVAVTTAPGNLPVSQKLQVSSSEDGAEREVLSVKKHLPLTRRGKSSSGESDSERARCKMRRVVKCNMVNKDEKKTERLSEKDLQEDTVSFSITYSLLKSDGCSSKSPSDKAEEMEVETKEESKTPFHPVRGDPPWMEGIDKGPDLVFRYQLPIRNVEDVLKKDLEILQNMKQPELVNKQLAQLQSELEQENQIETCCYSDEKTSSKLNLEFSILEEDLEKDTESQLEAMLQLLAEDM
ncbi:period circadian protein-like [Limulus polyphemus]|uniref:Period circadian protein n=1 Tax=Limulus polyphemus TaxID=6850 RepID=A0ABM1SRA9_LIMPO|nr:period circadian protein-like [Limulus polyphemus]